MLRVIKRERLRRVALVPVLDLDEDRQIDKASVFRTYFGFIMQGFASQRAKLQHLQVLHEVHTSSTSPDFFRIRVV